MARDPTERSGQVSQAREHKARHRKMAGLFFRGRRTRGPGTARKGSATARGPG